MNRPQKEQEITEKYFLETIFIITGGRDENIRASKKLFELAQSYHKQELAKAFMEGQKELPTEDEIKIKLKDVYQDDGNKASYWYQQGVYWLRDKAAVIIAEKDALIDRLQYAETDKDNLIKEREETIRQLKDKGKNLCFCGKEPIMFVSKEGTTTYYCKTHRPNK